MSTQPAAAVASGRRAKLTPTDMALLGVVAVWGFGYVTFSLGQREIPTGLFNLLRYLIATPLFWLSVLRTGEDWRLPRRDWPRAVLTGVVGVLVYSMVFATSTKLTSAANISLLLAMSPVWAVLMQWAGGKGAPTVGYAFGSLVAFGGAAMVIGFGANRLTLSLDTLGGDLVALAASVIWAWYGVAAQPLLRNHSGAKVQAWINLIALSGFALWQAPAALHFDWASVSLTAWVSLLFVALAVTVFAHTVWYNAIAKVGPDRVLLAMYLIPALAATGGALFLGQPFRVLQVAGAVVALVGVAMVRRSAA